MCWKAFSESFNVPGNDEELMPKPLDVLFVTPPNRAQIYQERKETQRVIPFTGQRRGAHAKVA